MSESDSLKDLVGARDRKFTEAKRLRLLGRGESIERRVCGKCWHVALDKRFQRDVDRCPDCGGELHEVSL